MLRAAIFQMHQGNPVLGAEGNTLSIPDACLLSWRLWQLHPCAAPWFGWGTGLAIPRKCLPPVQAGIPAHTPLLVVEGGLMECFLSAGQGDQGPTWAFSPPPPGGGSAQSSAPSMATSLLLAVWGMNQLSQLVKS